MAFFDAIKAKLADFGQDVANQSQMMTESVQIQEVIAAEEAELNLKYQALGRVYYVRQAAARKEGAATLLEDISAFEGIERSLKKLDELQAQLTKVQHGGN